MLTSSQRAKLRGMAQTLDPIFHIGKNGVNDNLAADISTALDAHELIKVAVLKNSPVNAREALDDLCARLGAEPVVAIGGKFALYRFSKRDDVEHIAL